MKAAELMHGDSYELLPKFKPHCVDAIITDPPYNISQDNNLETMGRTGINFGDWDYTFDQTGWIKYASRIIKPSGNIVIFNSWRNLGIIADELEAQGFIIKDMIRWKKSNPMPRNRDRRFVVDYEVAIWAVKDGPGNWTFNRINDTYDIPEILCGSAPASEKTEGEHPTQKPVEVMEWILEHLTNEGDTILDPFMGKGTTGVACQKQKRLFIGIEKEEEHYLSATKRVVTDIVDPSEW